MRFSRDRRGQSVVVGTVILFGFLILALSLYQVQVVPQENTNVEFEHSQQVENEFIDLRNAILNTAQSEGSRLTSLTLGTRYPQRTFSLNPPPATGQLSTSEQQTVSIESASVTGHNNVELFWEAQGLTFPTKSVRYSPSYNEYQNAPDLVYENSIVVAEFDGTALTRTGQTSITNDADRISLTLIDGNLSESGIERREIDPEVLSRNARSVTLEPDGGEVVVTLPTTVSEEDEKRNDLASAWNETFESGVDRTVTATADGIRIEIATTESVQLRLAQVGVGTGTSTPNESTGYIKKVSSNNGIAVAEVRDRFNNPVEDAEVEIDVNDDGTVDQTNLTDEEGRVEYETDTVSDVEMNINGASGGDPWESVLFENLGTTGGSGGDFDRVYNVSWNDPRPLESGTTREVNGTVRSNGEFLDNATVDFATNSSIAIFQDGNTSTTTVNGDFSTNLTLTQEGTATLFAASGDDVDRTQVEVINDGGGGGPLPSNAVAYYDENGNSQYDEAEETYTVEGLDELTVDGTLIVSRDAVMEDGSLGGIEINAERIVVEDGVELRTTGGGQDIELTSTDDILLNNANIQSVAPITIDAGGQLNAQGASIVTTGGGSNIDLTSGELMNLNSAEIQSVAPIIIDAGGQFTAQDASIITTGGGSGVTIDSGASIDMSDAEVDAINVELDSSGFINLDRTSLAVASFGELSADLTGNADLFVEDAEFTSGGDPTDLTYGPGQSVNVIGEPAVGGTSN